MSTWSAIRSSLGLLSRRDRHRLVAATVIQMATALLDLVGVILIGVVAGLSVAVMSGSAVPSTIQGALDLLGLGSRTTTEALVILGVVATLLLILKSLLNVFLTRRILQFLAGRQAAVSGQLAQNLLSRPLAQLQLRSTQETSYLLTSGVYHATMTVLGQGSIAAAEVALLAVLSAGLMLVSPVMAVLTIVYFAAIAWSVNRLFSDWAGRLGERATAAEVASNTIVHESLRTYREMVVANRRDRYISRFQRERQSAADVQADIQLLALLPKYVFETALVIGAVVLAVSQFLTRDLAAAVAVISVFLVAGSRIIPSMLRLQGAALTVRAAGSQAAPAYILASELGLAETSPSSLPIHTSPIPPPFGYPDLSPDVRAEHVSVVFGDAVEPSLRDVSVSVDAGQSLGLVGATGSGKTTLLDVLVGIRSPDSGTTTIGGLVPLEAIDRWPGAIAYVPQHVEIVDASVRSNVALGLESDEIDDNAVWDALERAQLADFLRTQRQGLDTRVGEFGVRLSGGQRQRLGIARALYTRPVLLALDEATSALDAETEWSITATLAALQGQVTTITVAHRLATVRHCNRIALLRDGCIDAVGTFDEVRDASPAFAQMAARQGL